MNRVTPTNNEKYFPDDTLLVSKTDTKGKITYCNEAFIHIVGLNEDELLNQPHNIIRHPDMPQIVFKLLWDYVSKGNEIHAYVKNICKDGSFYWVMANVTPSLDLNAEIIGYHSARRNPSKKALEIIKPLYKELLELEKSGGMKASEQRLFDILNEKGMDYDEFILSI